MSELGSIWQSVDAHAISIKHLELQMALLSLCANQCQLGSLPSHIVQNPKNYGHCMAVTTGVGKQTIDPPMSSSVEYVIRVYDEVVDVSG